MTPPSAVSNAFRPTLKLNTKSACTQIDLLQKRTTVTYTCKSIC